MLDTDFCDALNAYTAQAESSGQLSCIIFRR